MKIKDPTGRLARWSIYLSQFDIEIVHRKGRLHNNADYLSRAVLINKIYVEEKRQKCLDPWENSSLIHFLGNFKNGTAKK